MKGEKIFYVTDLINIGNFIQLDLNEFVSFNVGSKNDLESNSFLSCLWDEIDCDLSPNNKTNCPWAYVPTKHIFGDTSYTYFGSMRTRIGYIHVAVSYKRKGSINQIHFYSFDVDLSGEQHGQLKTIVKRVNQKKDHTHEYIIQCLLKNNLSTELLEDYQGENFHIINNTEDNILVVRVSAQTSTDAYNKAANKIDRIIDFLSVETNIVFESSNFSLINELEGKLLKKITGNIFQNNVDWENDLSGFGFIDFFPIIMNKILLSFESIFIIDRILYEDYEYDDELYIFLKSCYHFRSSLKLEFESENYGEVVAVTKEAIFSKRKDIKIVKNIMDNSVTGYISAIETVTLNLADPKKCEECGQLKYGITNRIKLFIDKYLDEGFGDVFKKIYNFRSLYLHTGENCTNKYIGPVKPLMDSKTGTGAIDYGFISIWVNNYCKGVGINNLREWTSYSLRNYYRTQLYKN